MERYLLSPDEVDVQAPHMVSTGVVAVEQGSLPASIDEAPTACGAFPFTFLAGLLDAPLQPGKCESLAFPFGLCSCEWGWRHIFSHLQLTWSGYCLKVFLFYYAALLVSQLERAGFWGRLFKKDIFLGCWLFLASCLGYTKQEDPGNSLLYHFMSPKVPTHSASSPYFRDFLHLFNIQDGAEVGLHLFVWRIMQ